MNDAELMKRLSEYLSSGKVNVNINNGTIESAQSLIAEQNLSEEQLVELDNPRSAKAIQAKQQKLLEAVKEAYQEEAQKRLEAHRAEWDAQMHRLGDREYSGAELHAMHGCLKDPKEQDALADEIARKEGISKEEAEKRVTQFQEYLTLKEKERNKQELTDAEKRRLLELQNNPQVAQVAEVQRALQETGFGSKNGQNLKIEKGTSSQDTSVQVRHAGFLKDKMPKTGTSSQDTSVQVGHAGIIENNNSNNIESDQSYSIRNSSRASYAQPLIVAQSIQPTFQMSAAGEQVGEPKASQAPLALVASKKPEPVITEFGFSALKVNNYLGLGLGSWARRILLFC